MDVKQITEKQIREYIKKVRWQTSKDKSHSYTVKKWTPGLSGEFEAFVMYIREKGYAGFFGKTRYKYFDIGGFKYWSMGAPLGITIIINRTEIGG